MSKPFLLSALLIIVSSFGHARQMAHQTEDDFKIVKGRYYGALTFSLDQRKAENENQLIRQVIQQNRLNYRVVGNFGYAIADNFSLGIGMGHGRQKEELISVGENGDEVTSKRLQQGFSIAPNMRNYIPIGTGQLQILIQTELGFTFGESLERIFYQDEIDKIQGDFLDINLGVNPGLILFFDRHWSFETTVGVAGLSTRIEEEVVNDDFENRQRIQSASIDLRLNLLQLNLGVARYF
jgi:hypothetical protein